MDFDSCRPPSTQTAPLTKCNELINVAGFLLLSKEDASDLTEVKYDLLCLHRALCLYFINSVFVFRLLLQYVDLSRLLKNGLNDLISRLDVLNIYLHCKLN